jgi:CheY-like chemotaxis protein
VLDSSIVLRRAMLARTAARGARILWVDDNPGSNSSELLLLRSLGAEVHTAISTQEAVTALQAGSWDVVLSDMARSGRSDAGIELLTWMRHQLIKAPVVFYVGVADPARDRPLGSFGLTNRADELLHLVFDVLERRRL